MCNVHLTLIRSAVCTMYNVFVKSFVTRFIICLLLLLYVYVMHMEMLNDLIQWTMNNRNFVFFLFVNVSKYLISYSKCIIIINACIHTKSKKNFHQNREIDAIKY